MNAMDGLKIEARSKPVLFDDTVNRRSQIVVNIKAFSLKKKIEENLTKKDHNS